MTEIDSTKNPVQALFEAERDKVEKKAKEAIAQIERVAKEAIDAYNLAIIKSQDVMNVCGETISGLDNIAKRLNQLGR